MSQNTSSAVMQQRREVRWYFTGKPCPKGHIAKRNISNRECRACVDEKKKARRLANIDQAHERERARYHRLGAKKKMQMRESRRRHIEKRRAEDRLRYHKNPEPKRRQASAWWKTDARTRALSNQRVQERRLRVKCATPSWLTAEQRKEIASFYLEAAHRQGEWHVDHIIPLRGETVCGLHVPWNLQVLTGDDNRRKRNALRTE